jgi:hypothetical protein
LSSRIRRAGFAAAGSLIAATVVLAAPTWSAADGSGHTHPAAAASAAATASGDNGTDWS